MEILLAAGVEFDVVEYLKTPLNKQQLRRVVDLLDVPAQELVRRDKFFKDQEFVADEYATKDAVIELLVQHPRLMQRPVAMSDSLAIIARPGELVKRLLVD